MVEAGRSTRGERDGNTKLKAEQVQEIRRLRPERVPYHTIGERFGVSESTVYQINSGKIWAWLPPDPT